MKKYPMLEKDGGYIPQEMMKEHENQCYINHGQSVGRLANRGGTSYLETFYILNNSTYSDNSMVGTEEYEKKAKYAKKCVYSMAYEWMIQHGLLDGLFTS